MRWFRLPWIRFLILTALRNLWRAPRRTVFSLTAIAVAVASLIVFRSFVDGVKTTFANNIVTSYYGHYQIYRKGYLENKAQEPYAYPVKEPEKLKADLETTTKALEFFTRRTRFHSLLSFNERTLSGVGLGIDAKPVRDFLTLNQVSVGKHLADSSEESIFLGQGLARNLGAKPGDMVTVVVSTATGSLNALDLEVAGIFKTGVKELDEAYYFIHHGVSEKLLRTKGTFEILIGLSSDQELSFRPAIEELLKTKYPDLELKHWHELAGDFFENTMAWLENIFGILRIIVLFIAMLSILNVFMIGLLERTGEFGTLRAIGTHRGEIAWLIVAESLLQSVVGGLLGIGVGVLIISVFLKSGVTMPPPMNMTTPFQVIFTVPWDTIPSVFGLCLIVAGGAGLFPAIRMSRINIVLALGRNV